MQPEYGPDELDAIKRVLEEGYLNEGRHVREFERRFADYVGAKYCILVPNGTLALWLALQTPSMPLRFTIPDYYSIFAANALVMAGKDVEIHDETDGLMLPVHVNGRIADTSRALIEDCCQAPFHHTKGIISCYSFHSTKLITCGGIGGAVCLDNDFHYEHLSAIKDHGRPERSQGKPVPDIHSFWGTNLKMSDINAAFGIEQLKRLPKRLEMVKQHYRYWQGQLGESVEWLGVPSWRVDCLAEKPLGTPFYTPTHRQPIFSLSDERFPKTTDLCRRGRYLT